MSSVRVDHPETWIGIPEDIPGDRWSTAYEWASDLIAELAQDVPPDSDDDRFRLRDYLVAVANSREERGASRVYVSIVDWTSPVFVADLNMYRTADVGGLTLAELAGESDTGTVEKPIVTPFSTDSGIEGARCVRYYQLPENAQLVGRVDYVFPVPDGFLRLYTAQFDLVQFERVKPRMDALARTVRIVP